MRKLSMSIAAAALIAACAPAQAANEVKCRMTFSLSGWSVFYKTASGSGTIRCENGQSLPVRISAKGGGLTFGRSTIDDGIGEFSGVIDITQTLGSYASAEAHAGASRSSKAMVVTKGEVSLALSGVGRGWDLGVGFGKFTIEAAR